jgi:hypothetical protein
MSTSYYFPFGANERAQTQSISYALSAITASLPITSTVLAITASYAINSGSRPSAGENGVNQSFATCGVSTISGSKGLQGPTGSKGPDSVCPPGTTECVNLHISLSANWTNPINGGRGVNYYRASGSQFSKVCIQVPPGCTVGVCPPALPTSSVTLTYPSIS